MPDVSEPTALAGVVTGRVQGVGFRWETRRQAVDLGIAGWVRNRRDGSVEVLIQGPRQAVDRMASWLRRGPAGAVVRSVALDPTPVDATLAGFEILR